MSHVFADMISLDFMLLSASTSTEEEVLAVEILLRMSMSINNV
jgi:hypothetical protein